MKVCKTCNQEKPFESFGIHKRPNNKTYYRSECRQCCVESLKAYKATDAGKKHHSEYMRKYLADQRMLANLALQAIKDGILKDPR